MKTKASKQASKHDMGQAGQAEEVFIVRLLDLHAHILP
jgi:hypothetical protein